MSARGWKEVRFEQEGTERTEIGVQFSDDGIRRAREAERKEGRRKLFPIRLTDFRTLEEWKCPDSKSGQDLAEEVRQYFIPDFSNWKDPDDFEKAFERLLRDLKAEEAAAPAKR